MLSTYVSREQFDVSLQPFDKAICFLIFPARGQSKNHQRTVGKKENPSIEDFFDRKIKKYGSPLYHGLPYFVLEKIDRLQAEFAAEQQAAVNIDQRIGLIQQYVHPEELSAEMLNALIEKIAAHEKIIGTDGVKEQAVDICCRFTGKIA